MINRLIFTDRQPFAEEIANITRDQILEGVNQAWEKDVKEGSHLVEKFLGGLVFDKEGKVIGAKATKIDMITETNITEALTDPFPGQSSPVSHDSMNFEEDLRDALLETAKDMEPFEVSVFVNRGYDDVVNQNIIGNYNLLFSGFAIMFFYVLLMLGKFNCVEQRVYLSIAGLAGIVLGSVFCLGFCSAFGLMFTQLHNVLPFLMLGIGIDDMFVLVQCYENLTKEERKLSLEDRMGKTLSSAGMAISVTSVTNIVAFLLGATTVIPALRSFCAFCGIGILAIFIYTLTFFTACIALDQRRVDEKRNGCCIWIKHGDDWKPNELTQKNLVNCFFEKLATVMAQNMVSKLTVSLTAVCLFAVSCYGISQLEQRFEERWLIPDDSYLAKWFDARQQFFNQGGERGVIYFAELELNNVQLDRIKNLVINLKAETKIITEVDQWAVQFAERFHNGSLREEPKELFAPSVGDRVDNSAMIRKLGKYLQTPEGLQYRDRFAFADNVEPSCVEDDLPPLAMFMIEYQHPLFSGPTEHVPAMERVKELVAEAGIEGRVFARSARYEYWEMDGILSEELIRSMLLALVCVFLIVIFMLANITGAILVLLCVIFTLVDVMGFMYFWGLTIDTTASMLLIVCIGLSVDYAAHIAHGFLEEQELEGEGSRLQKNRARAQATLIK